ncbi:hypothetical protein MCEGKSH29_01054 [Candidatus Nanopelagicaceae bacterium]
MKLRRVALVTTALFLAPLISISSANADNQPPTSTNQGYSDAMAAYKIELEKFREVFKVFENNRRVINQSFKDAIDKAMSDARNLNATPQTQMQRRQSMSVKQGAVISATAARDAAIEALGPPPVAPTPPAKPPRAEKSRK